MQFHDLLGNGQAQPRAAGATGSGTVHPVEFLEDGLEHGPRDLVPLIDKRDLNVSALLLGPDLDHRVFITVGHRISQDIVKHPGKLVRISVDLQVFFHFHLAAKPFLLENAVELVRQLLQHQWTD